MVVSDTSPLSYLILIGEGDLLGILYEEVLVPPAVENELDAVEGPAPVRRWIEDPPSWLRVESPSDETLPGGSPDTAELLQSLDRGEREAIHLAAERNARLLVIDERDGRRVAWDLRLSITGTLGVLDAAAADGRVDPASAVERLRGTSFRASEELYQWLIERHS